MLRPREQVHRLHLFGPIPMLFQPFGIPGGSGGVAADIDHPAGGHGDDSGKGEHDIADDEDLAARRALGDKIIKLFVFHFTPLNVSLAQSRNIS